MEGDLLSSNDSQSPLLREATMLAEAAGAPRGFVEALYSGTAAEDLRLYSAAELAAASAGAFKHLTNRTPGQPKIRLDNPPSVGPDRALVATTVIDITNDDMPFLLDSVMGELAEQGLAVQLVAHPIFAVDRGHDGKLKSWLGLASAKGGIRESFIHLHVQRIDETQHAGIRDALQKTLSDVQASVRDWKEMLGRVQAATRELVSLPSPLPKEEVEEAREFLEWLIGENFLFLGTREYALKDGDNLEPIFETGRGILRGKETRVLRRGGRLVTTTPELSEFLRRPVQLIITKANVRSRVHRRAYMDYIGVKRFDATGRLTGELCIVGLFTSTAYTRSARSIPFLRRKIENVSQRARLDPSSHSGKALVNVIETYPRDELFQIDEEQLYRFAIEIMQLDERPRVRVLSRKDKFDRFVSVLVYVPRERYNSVTREQIGAYLAETFNGRVSAFYPFFPDGPLARVHFIIGRDEGPTPEIDRAALEAAIVQIVRNWTDELAAKLSAEFISGKAFELERNYREAFSAAYRESFTPEAAVKDIRILESLKNDRRLAIDFYRRESSGTDCINLKVWSCGRPIPLSERVPVLEHMGFNVINERTYTIEPRHETSSRAWLHDTTLTRAGGGEIDLDALDGRLESALIAVMHGRAESDGYNALVLAAGLSWREAVLLRMLSRYLRQVRVPFSQDYLWSTMRLHAGIAKKIVGMFETRFDPRLAISPHERGVKVNEIAAEIEAELEDVQSLDEDRILRRFMNLVQAAVRTNFYQIGEDGQPRQTITVKFESRKIQDLPAPKPLFEIFVYSPRVEGVHLRFGKVARGGLRWSDRPQDFRTEVLGLVKAQQVKNAVIVPVGAKGGFVPKRMPAGGTREEVMAEGTACYEIFVSSLLELTDNIGPNGIEPPDNIVRHDADDPYLVVAADKGTATFSDLANSIAIRRGFWLGDAFASGGSVGYDHKKMGITARGGWEAVKRHFREMDVDIRTTPFTVTGVGDMSGDVFGNGMLLEKTIKLVAAFDHRDIFIDPSPDPEKSFKERERMFALPRSSWQDYDRSLISKGGGVFPRNLKKIPLSAEMRALLGIETADAAPAEVMQAILRMPADLLWFGGIGTYVRASFETDEKAGDRANDHIRIAANELRCKVIGEGANLGMTQFGRIEAARAGVRLNTDAIDNSAGVNSSDLEVNLKIALGIPVREKKLSLPDRNKLLAEMTQDVGLLVLRNNYLQTLALSLAQRRAGEDLGFEKRLIQTLEARELLDRAVEFLPSDGEIAERQMRGEGLRRPELAVTLAYAKITLYDDLLASDVPDDPYLARELVRYFPKVVSHRFPEALAVHRLRREIIATMLANSIINRGGPSFVVRMMDRTGKSAPDISKAFVAVRDAFGMTALNGEIDALDGKVAGETQLALYSAVQDLLLDRVSWFLRRADLKSGLEKAVSRFQTGIEALEMLLDKILSAEQKILRDKRAAVLLAAKVPEPFARKIANLPLLAAAPDAVLVSGETGKPLQDVTLVYFSISAMFEIDRLIEQAKELETEDHFDRLALDHAVSEIASALRSITIQVLEAEAGDESVTDKWVEQNREDVERVRSGMREIAASGLTLSKLAVAVSLLDDLAGR